VSDANGNGRRLWLQVAAGLAVLLVGAAIIGSLGVRMEVSEVRRDMDAISKRMDDAEDAIRTNRMTRMAPETRSELDAVRREIDAILERIRRLEARA
jgi:ClpP class serine protease